MRVLVLGAGVVGVATAYSLWRAGHDVTVLERHASPGQETSFGNAGGLCPSFAGPWAAPGMISKVIKLTLQKDSPISFRPRADWRQLSWILRWMAECTPERFHRNKLRMQRSAHYSLRCLRELMAETGLSNFDFYSGGVLQIFQTDQELALGRLSATALNEFGIPWEMLEGDQLLRVEPGLKHSQVPVKGGLYLPADASGDSFKFCAELSSYLSERGVQFLYDVDVKRLVHQDGRVQAVDTSQGRLEADSYVLAFGSFAPQLLKPLGIKLPLYPLKGYSITVPVTDPEAVPLMPVMDEHNKLMISRLGQRIRAAGMAELTGYDLDFAPSKKAALVKAVKALFPQGLDWEQVSYWSGLRPMTPDGPPVLGPTPYANLFLNSGHGSNGWTQACGTSKVVADLIDGRRPDIDLEGLTLDRYKK